MSGHVFARMIGFGVTVTPYAPYQMEATGDSKLEVRVHDGTEWRTATFGSFQSRSPYGSKAALNAVDEASLSSVVGIGDVSPGPDLSAWHVQTSGYQLELPAGFSVHSNNYPRDPGMFYLVGPGGSLIFVQTPQVLPNPRELVGPGQIVLDVDDDPQRGWIELKYTFDGGEWIQRHGIATLSSGRAVYVTSQWPAHAPVDVAAAIHRVERTLQ